jgi:peptidoglycan-associated lipoprotein
MNGKHGKLTWAVLVLALAIGCKKQPPAPPPPPPPPPPAKVEAPKPAPPVITAFTVEPGTIQRGQAGTLRWAVQGAETVTIDQGVGAVAANGTRNVSPAARTTYRLTARNAGGDTNSIAVLNVADAPPPPPPPPPPPVKQTAPKLTLTERLAQDVQDVYFDYDRYEVREDASAILQKNVQALRAILTDFPNAVITLEGHCDERGSAEYNLGLGDRRASSVKEFLGASGVTDGKLQPVSYGKERPACSEASEDCYQKNRRVHFVAQ